MIEKKVEEDEEEQNGVCRKMKKYTQEIYIVIDQYW